MPCPLLFGELCSALARRRRRRRRLLFASYRDFLKIDGNWLFAQLCIWSRLGAVHRTLTAASHLRDVASRQGKPRREEHV